MKTIASLLFVVVLALPALASDAWKQEPDGFGGVAFASSPETLLSKIPAACKNKAAKYPRDLARVCSVGSYRIAEDLAVMAEFRFIKGSGEEPEFDSVELKIINTNFKRFKQLLLEKYGPPTSTDKKRKVDWILSGKEWDNELLTWTGDHVRITITETPQPLARSIVLFERIDKAKQSKAFETF